MVLVDDTELRLTGLGPQARSALYAAKCFTVGAVREKGREAFAHLPKTVRADIDKHISSWDLDHLDRARLITWLRRFALHHGSGEKLRAAADMLERDGPRFVPPEVLPPGKPAFSLPTQKDHADVAPRGTGKSIVNPDGSTPAAVRSTLEKSSAS